MRRKTIIAGHETWFHICAANECFVTYIGPFASEEAALNDAGMNECKNAHFLTQYVPDFGDVHFTGEASSSWYDIPVCSEVLDWVKSHVLSASEHPIAKHVVKHSKPYSSEERLHEAFNPTV